MRRTFVEFVGVTRVLKEHGVSDDSLLTMQTGIIHGQGVVMAGTAGLRKIRCGTRGTGKSGGIRVIYADYPDLGLCLLVAAFAKNVKGNLTKAEQNDLAVLKIKLDAQMRQRFAKTRK